MFSHIAERQMHVVRWILTTGWLLLIGSLFFDPVSPWLTDPSHPFSPLRIDPTACVKVQGVCLEEQPYALGTTIFWAIVVPSSIFILLIFGHELWRRICPLSFLSQIPRALGWQRQFKRVHPQTGKVRYELAKVKPGSWLGRNYLYLQFGLLYLGLCARILFINSSRIALFLWFLATIVAAIVVGYLYGGKSWCNYFCPMSPVQKIYAEPRGLFGSKGHIGDQTITQSMCRIVAEDGKEQSACVACQNPCIDIDSERSYWDGVTQPQQKFLYYGYVGLVVGYFGYYYLYAGNWDYYFSGAWAHQENQLDTLLNPGFYLFNHAIPIPKLVAAPLTLALSTALGYGLGWLLETRYRDYLQRSKQVLSQDIVQHRMFTISTFVVFHFFFIFAGRPLILLLPLSLQFLYEAVLVGLSTLWLYQTWQRNPGVYSRESLATRLRRQLSRLQLNVAQFLDGRSLPDLTTDEVYVLAKVLPGFTKEKRHDAYKGVLREALEEGYVNTSSSLEVLQQMRAELDISNEEHRLILEELGVEDPELLDPNRQRSRENLVRLTGYRRALERVLSLQQRQAAQPNTDTTGKQTIQTMLEDEPTAIQRLRQAYSLTLREETEIWDALDPKTAVVRRAEFLLDRLANLIQRYQGLNQPIIHQWEALLTLLRSTVQQKKRLLVTGLLEILEQVDDQSPASGGQADLWTIAHALNQLSPTVLQDLLEESALNPNHPTSWHQRLSPEVLTLLTQPSNQVAACSLEVAPATIATHLEALIFEPNPLIQATSLFMVYQVDAQRGQDRARDLLKHSSKLSPLVQDVATTLLHPATQPSQGLLPFPALEKLVYLYNSDFFHGVQGETLIQLADRAIIKTCTAHEVITEAGDTCRELILLIEGGAQVQQQQNQQVITTDLHPGQVLDELEVLTHSQQSGTIVATSNPTRLLAIPVDTFDDLLDRDSDLARRVLELESRHLQRLLHQRQILPELPRQI